MSWEDDVLREFEQLKQTHNRNNDLILARSEQRKIQAPNCWLDLQGKLRGLVVTFNVKADRTLFDIPMGPSDRLAIRREDGALLEVEYLPAMFRASFAYPTCPGHNRDYELRVMPISGNDTTVWVDQQTKDRETAEKIAAESVRKLIRCGL